MNERRVCRHVCHRYRTPDKMDGTRCADREACHRFAMRANPVRVPKSVLRKQYGSGSRIE